MKNQTPCPGCGEIHDLPEPRQMYEIAVSALIEEATKIAAEEPGKYPRLEEALRVGNAAASLLLIEALQGAVAPGAKAPAPKAAEGDDRPGMYL